MPKEIIRYQCDYCNKHYSTKGNANKHQKQCFANPKTRSCRTCKNFFSEMETVYNPNHGGDPGSTDYEVLCFYCSRYEKELNNHELKLGVMRFQTNCKLYIASGTDNFKI